MTVVDACENQWLNHKDNCSGFVCAVAAELGITLTGDANSIVDQISGADWTSLADGIAAKAAADSGHLVIAGLKGGDMDPPEVHGHVAVIVPGDLAHNRYPAGYWGKLHSVGEKSKTINYAWDEANRDRVIYAAYEI